MSTVILYDHRQHALANENEVSPRTTGYWMRWLSGMQMRGDTLDGLREQPAAYQRITAKEVREVLARYITPERRVAIIGMPRVTVYLRTQ